MNDLFVVGIYFNSIFDLLVFLVEIIIHFHENFSFDSTFSEQKPQEIDRNKDSSQKTAPFFRVMEGRSLLKSENI